MVTIEEIQAAYYMVAATGVLVAAAFYVLNLRETIKNRRATTTNNMLQFFYSEEGQQRYIEVLNMQWSDFEDFKKKFDSSTNTKFFAQRASTLSSFNALGQQYRNGIISLETFDDLTARARPPREGQGS